MGVSTSVEEHQRIHSLVYENGKKELALIPLTSQYFPSKDCVSFRRFVECRKEERVQYMYCRSDSLNVTEASAKDDPDAWHRIFVQDVDGGGNGLMKGSNADVREALKTNGKTACRPMWCAVALVWDSVESFENDAARKAHLISIGDRWVEVVGYFGLRDSHPAKADEKPPAHDLGMFWTKAAGDHLTNYVMLLAARCYLDQVRNIVGPDAAPYFPACHMTTQENNVPVLKAMQAFASSFDDVLRAVPEEEGDGFVDIRRTTVPTPHFDMFLPPQVVRGGANTMAAMISPLATMDADPSKSNAFVAKREIALTNNTWAIHAIKDNEMKPTQFKSVARGGPAATSAAELVHFQATFQGENASEAATVVKDVWFQQQFADLCDHVNDICAALAQCRALSQADLVAKGQEITQNGSPTSLLLVSETAPSGRSFLFAVNTKKKSTRSATNRRNSNHSSGSGTPIPVQRCDWIPQQNFEHGGFESHVSLPPPAQPTMYVNNPYNMHHNYISHEPPAPAATYLGGPPPPSMSMGAPPPLYPR